MCPFYTVAGMYELYEQLLPTKLYTSKKIKTCLPDDVMCRLCGNKISIVLFPDVIKSALPKFHIKLYTILNGERVKNNI